MSVQPEEAIEDNRPRTTGKFPRREGVKNQIADITKRLREHDLTLEEIKLKEQIITNVLVTCCLIVFIISLVSIRPYVKTVTNEIKFSYVAKEYKSNKKLFSEKEPKASSKKSNLDGDNKISLDTRITLNLFENFLWSSIIISFQLSFFLLWKAFSSCVHTGAALF